MRVVHLVLLFLIAGLTTSAQTEISHMHYNLTLYGNPFACDESTNNSDDKDEALEQIIAYALPDVLTVNEMRDQDSWADRLLTQALEPVNDAWERAELTDQYTWSSIVNACYFRGDKLQLHNQEVVHESVNGGSLLRPIDLYTFYPHQDGEVLGDTLFFTVIVAHLAASDADDRLEQTEALMAHIESRGPANYILTGDLNMDAETEAPFQALINPVDADLAFVDPVSTASTWGNNPSVALYHTQSTRLSDTNNGCFSGGGLDDRFDITILSPSVWEGTAGLGYVSGSYEVLGQSGSNYNQALQINANPAVPSNIAQALYDLSDHLPVMSSYSFAEPSGLYHSAQNFDARIYPQGQALHVWFEQGCSGELALYDLQGKLLRITQLSGSHWSIDMSEVQQSMVIVRVISPLGVVSKCVPLH